MSAVEVRPFEVDDAVAVARLATLVQWPSLTDAGVVERVCTAPGASSYVAVTGDAPARPALVGWAQALGDGILQAHLSFLAVHPDHRRRGIARLLLVATFQATRAARIDLITEAGGEADPFYATFEHRRMHGFRLYPGAEG